MELIDLFAVFGAIEDEKYCVAKYTDLQKTNPGDDIDIFTFNVKRMARKIISNVQSQIVGVRSIKIYVSSHSERKCVVDVLRNGKIYVRFDLYGELPKYSRLNVKPGLFECSIEKAVLLEIGEDRCRVKVMAKEQDLIIRYLEYIEWYERRPDKIKHLNYILDKFEFREDRVVFLDDLHYYTGFPEVQYTIMKEKNAFFKNLKFIIFKCKGKSLADLWCIFKQKFL